VPRKATYYKSYWRTFQMSDHLPMWVDLQIDYSQEYLNGLDAEPPPPDPTHPDRNQLSTAVRFDRIRSPITLLTNA
jgi:hypothetical protein